MSEQNHTILGDEDFPSTGERKQERGISRRSVLKWAGAGFVATGLMGRGMEGFGEDLGVITTPREQQVQAALAEKQSEKEIPQENDPYITAIASRLGVKLLSLRQAYEEMGMTFNEMDAKEFADVLPMRWDHERADLLEKYFGYLPSFFHEKDGKGIPLNVTLTNFGNTSQAGEYLSTTSHNLMLLDMDVFSPNNPKGALEMLTHESTHHLQDLGYSRLNTLMPQLFNKDIKDFCNDTITWLDTHPGTADDDFFLGMLRYGVQDTTDDVDPSKPRTNTNEFEAVLSEFYIHGFDFFVKNLGRVYGTKGEDLYRYMRDDIFGGREYEQFPLDTSQ